MKINSVRKIVPEDYSADSRTLIQKLAQTLNPFLDQVTAVLSGQVTVRDNVKGRLYDVELAVGESTRFIAWTLNEKPTSVTLASLRISETEVVPSQVFSLAWTFGTSNNTTGIFLTFLGLDAAKAHHATILTQV